MIGSEAVALVKQILGFRTNLDATILTNMRQQQLKLELAPTKPWFLLSEIASELTTSGEPRVPLPADFLDEYEEGCLWYLDSEGTQTGLVKDNFDVLSKNYREEPAGAPAAYALTGKYFRIFPVPDASYTLKMLYYKQAAEIQLASENAWLKYVPELLVGKAGSMIAASLRDMEAVKIFDRMIQENALLLENQNEARKHANFDMQMGGPH